MGKGAKAQELANSGTAQNMSKGLYGNASNLYGSLAPELQNQAINPQGLGPTGKAAATTAAMQSAGGADASAVGSGLLHAARTRNAGGSDAAIGSSIRASGENLGKEAVGTELTDAAMKESQRKSALSGEQALLGTELGASQGALGLSNQALHDENQAPNFWQTYLLQAQKDAAAMAGAGG